MPKTLAEIALDAGLVNRTEVSLAARAAEQRGVPLVVALVRDAGVDELALLAAIRKQTRVPALDPAGVRPDPEALRAVPRDLCQRHRVLPVAVVREPGGGPLLKVAMADPTDAAAFAEVEHVAACEVDVAVLPLSTIEELTDLGFRDLDAHPALRGRRPFGEGIVPSTQPHGRHLDEDTGVQTQTVPFHSVADEADVELRLRALVRILEARGILAEGELDAAVIDLMRTGRTSDGD